MRSIRLVGLVLVLATALAALAQGYIVSGRPRAPWSPADLSETLVFAHRDGEITKDGSDRVSSWGEAGFVALVQTGGDSSKGVWDATAGVQLDGSGRFLVTESSITVTSFALFVGLISRDLGSTPIIAELSPDTNFNNGFYLSSRGAAGSATSLAKQSVQSLKQTNTAAWAASKVRARLEYDGTHASHLLYTDNTEEAMVTRSGQNNDPALSVTDDLYVGSRGGVSLFSDSDLLYVIMCSPIPSGAEIALVETWASDQGY